jgi:ribosome biogenesis GTPase
MDNSSRATAPLKGVITEVQRRTALVLGEDGAEHSCQYSPTIDLADFSNFAVGDRVEFIPLGSQQEPMITALMPRRSKLSRPGPRDRRAEELILAANVDALLVVSSVRSPDFNARLVDRYLALAEFFSLEAILCLNKRDLDPVTPPELEYLRSLGYPAIACSAKSGEGMDDLRRVLDGRMVVLSGPSGAGKSSLIRSLVPGADPRIGEVQKGTGKGRHTTTSSHLYQVGPGAFIIDTPGIRELGISHVERRDLAPLWRDIAPLADRCRFRDCMHVNEPGCAVRAAVEAGSLPDYRYQSYLRILEDLPE